MPISSSHSCPSRAMAFFTSAMPSAASRARPVFRLRKSLVGKRTSRGYTIGRSILGTSAVHCADRLPLTVSAEASISSLESVSALSSGLSESRSRLAGGGGGFGCVREGGQGGAAFRVGFWGGPRA
jgi:hypothetical protein